MTIQEVMTAIGSLGFPIVMSLILIFKVNKSIDNNTSALIKMTEAFNKLCDAINHKP